MDGVLVALEVNLHFSPLFLAVADAIRTSLGPKGMDKMVILILKILLTGRYCEVNLVYMGYVIICLEILFQVSFT